MIIEFVESYAKLIVSNPDMIKVSDHEIDPTYHEMTIFAHNDDLGKLIGSSGNMINALKTIINGCKAKNNVSYKIQVQKA